jgi:hypothetical protein|tara:strand:+ start:2390 stop:2944 length:555 start_codon:yes stop_codon:yes gene_type:complete
MANVKESRKNYDFSKKIGNGIATISLENGKCFINSDTEIMGIEINFKGKATIKPTLPNQWYLRGNSNKIIIFTLQNVPIKNQLLFEYEGTMKLISGIVANKQAKKIKCIVKKDESKWINQEWSVDVEQDIWDNFKDITPNGNVTKTSYIIDDDLPEVEKTKIKKTRRRTTTTTTRVSSEGSGGY